MSRKKVHKLGTETLPQDSGALVIHKDMSLEMLLPNLNGDDDIPDNVYIIAGISTLLASEKYSQQLFDLIYKILEEKNGITGSE